MEACWALNQRSLVRTHNLLKSLSTSAVETSFSSYLIKTFVPHLFCVVSIYTEVKSFDKVKGMYFAELELHCGRLRDSLPGLFLVTVRFVLVAASAAQQEKK